ncbi:unnamed protein product [Schistosoma margrebowiei]|uniref:Uncharacterized protein n=1 Tax=Schistosoma margrebowiei TaxID=48269 RepID=A0A183LFC2_9TREM|nr:unnamed protein product [Schistosoma margrebowiei]
MVVGGSRLIHYSSMNNVGFIKDDVFVGCFGEEGVSFCLLYDLHELQRDIRTPSLHNGMMHCLSLSRSTLSRHYDICAPNKTLRSNSDICNFA